MANLHVTYYRAFPTSRLPLAKDMISSETVVTSAGNAKSGATPDGAVIVCITGDAAHQVAYGTTAGKEADATISPRQYAPSGIPLWLTAEPSFKVAAITA